MKFSLYSDVQNFYSILVEALKRAERSITMMYYEFHAGEWAVEISCILIEKQATGVTVRLVVDEFGLLELPPFQVARNQMLMEELIASGVQVQLFRPKQHETSYFNRLHVKVCAIDGQTLFLGGSNIADEYSRTQDLNLRADGDIGPVIEQLFEYLFQPGASSSNVMMDYSHLKVDPPKLFLEDSKLRLVLNLPSHRHEVCRSLLGLILSARETIYINTWIFLPDREIVNALLEQLESGRHVNILLSDRTRVRFIDIANQVIVHRLVRAGAQIWRYAPEYMHANACWNEQGTILFGSANLDSKTLHGNYECSLLFKDQAIADQFLAKLQRDVEWSYPITPDTFSSQHWLYKGWAYLCLLAAAWL